MICIKYMSESLASALTKMRAYMARLIDNINQSINKKINIYLVYVIIYNVEVYGIKQSLFIIVIKYNEAPIVMILCDNGTYSGQ